MGKNFRQFTENLTWPIFLKNLVMTQELYFPYFGSDKPLWTLSYEFLFYVCAVTRWLKQVVTGHFAYCAVPTNRRALSAFRHYVADLCRPLPTSASATQPERRLHTGAYDEAGR